MKIKNISDVITNSSNEVFCFKTDDPFYFEVKNKIPEIEFTEFNTFEDIRKYVTSKYYYEWDLYNFSQNTHGEKDCIPLFDFYGNQECKSFVEFSEKTEDEIWEFFKDGYKNLLGYSFYKIDEGCHPSWLKKYNELESKNHLEKIKLHLSSSFKPGDIISVMNKVLNKRAIMIYNGGLQFKDPYIKGVHDLDQEIINTSDYLDSRLATPEEISEYENKE